MKILPNTSNQIKLNYIYFTINNVKMDIYNYRRRQTEQAENKKTDGTSRN